MLYIKPYPIDYRRPKAQKSTYKTLSEVVKVLERIYSHEDIRIKTELIFRECGLLAKSG